MNYLNWNFQEMSEKSAGRHGMVKASGTSFIYQDGSAYHPFGTTIYALAHQTEGLIMQFGEIGIESDLILFHSYDRWGFSKMSIDENRTYLGM